ncbi:hypothetical protein [Staphylococcus sp. EG-SA-23]|nr:hypothetical protein [Staphylococcus sp. EG-SA-23]MBN4916922.1 hypothetical protein [Staphylococcus sp. EG-SA-23]
MAADVVGFTAVGAVKSFAFTQPVRLLRIDILMLDLELNASYPLHA